MKKKFLYSIFHFFLIFLLKLPFSHAAGIYAYIPSENRASISIIDTATDTIIPQTISLDQTPFALQVSPDGKTLFVTTATDFNKPGSLSIIDISELQQPRTTMKVSVGKFPSTIAVSPNGTKVFIGNLLDNNISIIDITDSSSPKTSVLPMSNPPFGIAFSSDGKSIYITNGSGISVLDSQGVLKKNISTPNKNPVGVAVTPNGEKGYVTSLDDTVSVLDLTKNELLKTIKVPDIIGFNGITITPDGKKAYLADDGDPGGKSVAVIDVLNDRVIEPNIQVGNNPLGISLTPDGKKVYVLNFIDNTVSVLDTLTGLVKPQPITSSSISSAISNFITPLGITSPLNITGKEGDSFSYTLTAVSYRPLVALTADSLPTGLSFDSPTGTIHGTLPSSGTFNIKVGAKNDMASVSEVLKLTVTKKVSPEESVGNQNGGGCALGTAGEKNQTGSSLLFLSLLCALIGFKIYCLKRVRQPLS